MTDTNAKHAVWILMGSDSDWGVMKEAAAMLARFGVPYEVFRHLRPPFPGAYG